MSSDLKEERSRNYNVPSTRTFQGLKRSGKPIWQRFPAVSLRCVKLFTPLWRNVLLKWNGISVLIFLQEVRFIKQALFPVLMCDAAGRGDTEAMKDLCGQVTEKTTSFLVLINT